MTPILIALVIGLIDFIVITIVFRLAVSLQAASTIITVYLFSVPILNYTALMNNFSLADFIFSNFLFFTGFFGGILQLYNLASRGFSLRILLDASLNRNYNISPDWVKKNYSSGKGIAWMYTKRVNGMVETKLVIEEGSSLVLTSRGKRVAALFSWLRNLTNQPPMAPEHDI